jgi:molybdopterin-guanine dinucleotide biosynthesis protein A
VQVSGCILAGGAARRFSNRPKGLLQISSGLTIIDQLMHILGKAGVTDVAISVAQSGTYERSPVPVIHDRFSDAGPLAGIEAGLHHFAKRAMGVLFLPCDMPTISAAEIMALKHAFLERQAPGVVAVTQERMHPLCLVLRTTAHKDVVEAIEHGAFKARRLWKSLGVEDVKFPDDAIFTNINTPSDWEAYLRSSGRTGQLR